MRRLHLLVIGSAALLVTASAVQAQGHRHPVVRDCVEDIRDRREDVRDRRENVRDRREDVHDRREDRRDRRD